jgi:hypothetical protein
MMEKQKNLKRKGNTVFFTLWVFQSLWTIQKDDFFKSLRASNIWKLCLLQLIRCSNFQLRLMYLFFNDFWWTYFQNSHPKLDKNFYSVKHWQCLFSHYVSYPIQAVLCHSYWYEMVLFFTSAFNNTIGAILITKELG